MSPRWYNSVLWKDWVWNTFFYVENNSCSNYPDGVLILPRQFLIGSKIQFFLTAQISKILDVFQPYSMGHDFLQYKSIISWIAVHYFPILTTLQSIFLRVAKLPHFPLLPWISSQSHLHRESSKVGTYFRFTAVYFQWNSKALTFLV